MAGSIDSVWEQPYEGEPPDIGTVLRVDATEQRPAGWAFVSRVFLDRNVVRLSGCEIGARSCVGISEEVIEQSVRRVAQLWRDSRAGVRTLSSRDLIGCIRSEEMP